MVFNLCGRTAPVESVRWEPNRRTMQLARLSRAAATNKLGTSHVTEWSRQYTGSWCVMLLPCKNQRWSYECNKQAAGGEEGFEGRFKKMPLWLDGDRSGVCPCWVPDVHLTSNKSHSKKQVTASAFFHSSLHDGVQATPPSTELLF